MATDSFARQFQRLFLAWNRAGVKTTQMLFSRLGISQMEYIQAAREGILPDSWLHTTAEELGVDVTYIRTGKTV